MPKNGNKNEIFFSGGSQGDIIRQNPAAVFKAIF